MNKMNGARGTTAKIWLLVALVFALGGVTGASIDGILRIRASSAQSAPVSIRDTDAYFDTLRREVKLSGDQEIAIRAILDRTRDDYKSVCADVRPRYNSLRERAREQMRALLSGDQLERFDSIITKEDCQCPDQKR
jgi:hypothetical protein